MTARPDAVRQLPDEPGVYRFVGRSGRAIYLGRATSLRSRVGSYWGDLRGRAQLRRMIPQISRIEALVCASVHEAAWAERTLLEDAARSGGLPRWNRTPGGQESELYQRMDAHGPRPGLRAVYQLTAGPDVSHFGPYLGGRQVRTAISALLRVHPLHHAGTTMTPAEQQLARNQPHPAADPADLAASITAVLAREPDAVAALHRGLLERRERAVAEQRYEQAQRLTDELEAIDWLVAPQLLTTGEHVDRDLLGCWGDTAVRLVITAGRLRRWEVGPTPPSVAPPPEPWRDLLLRNAELADRLRRHPVR